MSDVAAETSQIAPESTEQAQETPVNPADEVLNSLGLNGEDSGEEVPAEGEETEELVEEPERKAWKLKVGGKEIEIDDEDELIKRAQMGYSADEKWQEASRMRKEMESFFHALQQDPGSALDQMGFDVDALAEQHIQRRIEEMQKSPEQLERENLQREIEKLKNEREKEQEEARSAEIQRMQDQYAVQIENDISDALDNAQTLPKSPYVVKRIADALLLAMNNGYDDISVNDILPVVENDIRSEIKDMFSAMPEELVEAVVGKDVLNKLRKRRVSRAKQVPTQPKVQSTGTSELKQANANAENKPKEKMSAKDFFKNLGSF